MRLLIINKRAIFVILLALVIVLTIITFWINRSKTTDVFSPDIFYQGNIDEKIVAFGCNVDWGNEYIPSMLEIFERENIKITYFVTGKWAEKNPELLMKIQEKGHDIGNHGYNHIDYDKLSYEQNKEEILKAHNVIKNTLNIDSKYFAPPSGAFNDNTIKAAKDLNYEVILWSIDTIDWRQDSTRDIIIKRIMDKLHNSAIVLMHPTEETLKALPHIIKNLYEKGYKIGTIGDVIINE